MEHPAIVAYRN